MNVHMRNPTGFSPIRLHRLSSAGRRSDEWTVRYDGLFDIFPESYWSHFTTLTSVALRCRLQHPARLRLIRRRVDGSTAGLRGAPGTETVLCDFDCDAAEAILVTPLAAADAPESLLLLEVVAHESSYAHPVPLLEAAWEANEEPVRVASLGLAITTFNRESFLIANLARLHGRMAGGCVVVVNHGPPGLEARLRNLLPQNPAIRWIDQENSGGAGGFTRGMVEHHIAGDVTHVLLMDDDIDLPDDLVERASAILSYTRPEVCLGGAMFDYHQRTRLFSAGDVLIPGSFGLGHIAPPEGCDVATTQGVDFLARIHRPDFNGWWCFAFPIEAIERVGLPMSCFIRGDDVEFGYRLKCAGMPTLGWPGLAVWHMPFADKSAPWHMFYDRRNSLFTNARYRRVGRASAIAKLVGGFTHHLLRYDYDRVRAMTLGIAAFNQGPGAMERWTHHDHAALIAATSTMALTDAETGRDAAIGGGAPRLEARRLAGVSRSLRMVGRLALDLAGWPIGHTAPHRLPPGAIWRPDFVRRPAAAMEYDAHDQLLRVYRRDPSETRRATWRCIRALAGMVLHFYRAAPVAAVAISSESPIFGD